MDTALITGMLGDIIDVAAWLTDDERGAVRTILWATPAQGDAAESLVNRLLPDVVNHVRLWPTFRRLCACVSAADVAADLAAEGRELPPCADWSVKPIFSEAFSDWGELDNDMLADLGFPDTAILAARFQPELSKAKQSKAGKKAGEASGKSRRGEKKGANDVDNVSTSFTRRSRAEAAEKFSVPAVPVTRLRTAWHPLFSTLPPEGYWAVQAFSSHTPGRWRDFTDAEWEMLIAWLDTHGQRAIVVGTGEQHVPSHPRLDNRVNQTSLLEAVDICRAAVGFVGVPSFFASVASKVFPPDRLAIRARIMPASEQRVRYWPHGGNPPFVGRRLDILLGRLRTIRTTCPNRSRQQVITGP